MSDSNPYEAPGDQSPPPGGEERGHPKGLYVLFGAEMFERLCYYGMRGLLTLYLTKALLMGDDDAFGVYGAYTALVYAAPVAGGKLADKVIGYRRAVIFGGVLMAVGEFMILGGSDFWLFAGMSVIIVGNGFFKANISTIVGRLYKDGDPRRDAGFTIFYMGINLGALLATLVVAPLGETYGYTLGFGLAGVGMLCGIGIFMGGKNALEGHGEPADMEAFKKYGMMVYVGSIIVAPALYAIIVWGQDILFWLLLLTLVYVCVTLLVAAFEGGDRVKRDRIIVLMILMVFNVVFWACFEQAGSSLTLFADRNVERNVWGLFTMPASQTQFFNPAFIIIFGGVFSWLWVKLDRINKNPSIPMKFGLGILQLGAGYLLLLVGASLVGDDYKVPLLVLGVMYLLHTTGELFLSPIGLSMVTKLAPKHMTGAVMGAWFLSFAFSNYLAAMLAKLSGAGGEGGGEELEALSPQESLETYVDLYSQMGWITVGIGVFLVLLSRPLNKMMHGVK
jgi:POT family proton-dependent oligopeptide transporter